MALADLRYAFRLLRRHPGSSAAIVLTLGLAIGANCALFTLINAALLAPLPIERADRFVNVYTTGPDGTGYGALSYPDFLDLRAADSSLDDALGYSGLMTTVTDGRSSEVIFGELVTANYFSLLGVRPQLGRGFEAAEGERGAQPVVVIGDRLWRRRFNADSSVIGRSISLNGVLRDRAGVPDIENCARRIDASAVRPRASSSFRAAGRGTRSATGDRNRADFGRRPSRPKPVARRSRPTRVRSRAHRVPGPEPLDERVRR